MAARSRSVRWFWVALLVVVAAGGGLRFWHLDRPHQLVFDETYYVKQAASYLQVGYELRWNADATPPVDATFNRGTPDVFLDEPDFVVHPPVGKWMIAGGQWLLGADNPWGWRFASATVGTLSLLMIGLIARRLFRSALLGVVAALLLAIEGHHYVHSRTGLLDVFLMFWVLAAFGCLLVDRDAGRRALSRRIEAGAGVGGLGPWTGVRPWRLAAAVCLGLAVGVKWSGLYFVVVFGLLTVLWDIGARRAAGIRRWFAGALLRDGVQAAASMLPVIGGTYLASWAGWFASDDAQDRQWGAEHPSARAAWVPDALRGLWHYHQSMYEFHVNLRTTHAYEANPWSWIVMGRPTAFFYESVDRGREGCRVSSCSEAITALGNPVIWWGAAIALLVVVFAWALARDWRAGAVLSGLAAGYLPWFFYQERTIYSFYAVAFVPWVVLALTYVLGLVLGRPRAPSERRLTGALTAGGVVVLAALAFWFFLPIYSAEVIPRSAWSDRMWLRSWI
ncbi:MAG: phospholipid carrier-dependent glycosyltransferase [Chloroflexota bacterium]|nr:phospholipid carrier-dependent glycosyltransferase [Chloroflexota bacterium]